MEKKLALTPKQLEKKKRNDAMVAEFDTYQGSITAIIDTLAKKNSLKPISVRVILTKAGKIGEGR